MQNSFLHAVANELAYGLGRVCPDPKQREKDYIGPISANHFLVGTGPSFSGLSAGQPHIFCNILI